MRNSRESAAGTSGHCLDSLFRFATRLVRSSESYFFNIRPLNLDISHTSIKKPYK